MHAFNCSISANSQMLQVPLLPLNIKETLKEREIPDLLPEFTPLNCLSVLPKQHLALTNT